MQVETFECQETIAEPIEASEEAIGIINELGLEGQQALINPATEESPETRVPYRKIRADEQFVYKTLCPHSSSLATFAECPIPLRVLQIAAHAKTVGIFKRFWVWSAQGETKDPVLVATTRDQSYEGGDTYILARWAEVLDEWPILVKKALEVWRWQRRQRLAEIKQEVEKEVEILDDLQLGAAVQRRMPTFIP